MQKNAKNEIKLVTIRTTDFRGRCNEHVWSAERYFGEGFDSELFAFVEVRNHATNQVITSITRTVEN